MQLALGMVEAPGAGPAVGAAVYRFVAAARLHRSQLTGQQIEGDLPAHLDKGLFATTFSRRGAIFEIAGPHRRTTNARIAGDRVGEGLANARGIFIPGDRHDGVNGAIAGLHLPGSPVHHRQIMLFIHVARFVVTR